MNDLKFSYFEKGNRREMFFGKSITIGEEEMAVALATRATSVGSSIEAEFIENLKSGEAAAFDTLVLRYSNDI